jgi:hypothetical protein
MIGSKENCLIYFKSKWSRTVSFLGLFSSLLVLITLVNTVPQILL